VIFLASFDCSPFYDLWPLRSATLNVFALIFSAVAVACHESHRDPFANEWQLKFEPQHRFLSTQVCPVRPAKQGSQTFRTAESL
jgi:hypothetical protein